MATRAQRAGFETLKLLTQAAWADRVVTPAEREHILRLAEQSGAATAHIAAVSSFLADSGCLPAPDFDWLRAHRDAALTAARDLMAIDSNIADDEEQLLARVEYLLDA